MNQYDLSMTGSAVRPASPKSVVRFSSHSNYIQHYGVPGQKWGVITKEYEPVAVDHRKLRTAAPKPVSVRMRKTVSSERTQASIRQPARQHTRWNELAEKSRKRTETAAKILVAAGALIAAYAGYKYVRATKATAYANTLNNFLKSNPNANVATAEGRELLRKGLNSAKDASHKWLAAKSTNSMLQESGKASIGKNAAVKIYKARHAMNKVSKIKIKGPSFMRRLSKYRLHRLANKAWLKIVL